MGSISPISDSDYSYAAFFDLDDTLIEVNSGKFLVREAYRQGLMRKKDLLFGLYLSVLYKLNLAHSTKVVEKMAFWLQGLAEEKIEELSQKICDESLFNRISQEIVSEIEKHRKAGAKIVLLSAALPYICIPIAKKLMLNDVICSTLEVENGYFTGYPDGPLVFGPEKKTRITAYCQQHNLLLSDAYCYADSFSDLAMLQTVGHPVVVRPDRRLGNVARKKRWRKING